MGLKYFLVFVGIFGEFLEVGKGSDSNLGYKYKVDIAIS